MTDETKPINTAPDARTDDLRAIDMSIRLLRSTSLLMALALSVPIATNHRSGARVRVPRRARRRLKPAWRTQRPARTRSARHLRTMVAFRSRSVSMASLWQGRTRPVDQQRQTDVDLESVDIQVKFDGLGVKPVLNVSTVPPRQAYQPGERVRFLATTNYAAWIARQELLIYDASRKQSEGPLHRIPVSRGWRGYLDDAGGRSGRLRLCACASTTAKAASMRPAR